MHRPAVTAISARMSRDRYNVFQAAATAVCAATSELELYVP